MFVTTSIFFFFDIFVYLNGNIILDLFPKKIYIKKDKYRKILDIFFLRYKKSKDMLNRQTEYVCSIEASMSFYRQ